MSCYLLEMKWMVLRPQKSEDSTQHDSTAVVNEFSDYRNGHTVYDMLPVVGL